MKKFSFQRTRKLTVALSLSALFLFGGITACAQLNKALGKDDEKKGNGAGLLLMLGLLQDRGSGYLITIPGGVAR